MQPNSIAFSAVTKKTRQPPHLNAKDVSHDSEGTTGNERDSHSPSHHSQSQHEQYQGYFTADAIYLDKQLTNRLKEASDNEGKKMQAFTQTFNEIIKRDKNFGSLLLKIKQAYDEYIRRTMAQQEGPSPVANHQKSLRTSYEDTQQQLQATEIELKAQKQKYDE